jgi:hypothetical protein
VRRRQPGRHGTSTGDRDLLAQDRPASNLETVHRAGNASTGVCSHKLPQGSISGERLIDRFRIGIEIEERPAPSDRGGQITDVREGQSAGNVIGMKTQRSGACAVRQIEAPAVGITFRLLNALYCSVAQEREETLAIEGLPPGEAQR